MSAILACHACGPSLPGPSTTKHPADAYVVVPYPPPAALAEVVAKRPSGGALVWLDGDWEFRGRRYAWHRGGWFKPPDNARYAASDVIFAQDGRVMFAPGAWYGPNGVPLDDIRPVAPATTPKNEFTSETEAAR